MPSAMSSAIGLWDEWNAGERAPYGSTEMYVLGATWLEPCFLVEDWGAGRAWLGTLIEPHRYRAIDGSSPFAEVPVDLVDYRSKVPGIFMRAVLEHNYRWKEILTNALESFTERMALVIFTPFTKETHEIDFVVDPGVPDISFRISDLTDLIESYATWTSEALKTTTHYGEETIFYIEKKHGGRPNSSHL